jgi:uncharacterized phage protein (TIGR01671 family)
MRDIKFRGKRIDNGEWVYGSFHYETVECEKQYFRDGANNHYLCLDIRPVIEVYDDSASELLLNYPVRPKTVGQSTGLCDKNSTEIYEGDILGKSGYWSLVVEYQRIMPLNSIQYSNSRGWSIYGFDSSYWEVIGNIHDAEMLEVRND